MIPYGTRVKPSSSFPASRRGIPQKEGTVITKQLSGAYQDCERVLWDGRKTPETIHRDFIEPVDSSLTGLWERGE